MNLTICTHVKYTMAWGTDQNQGKIWFGGVIMNNCVHI